MHVSTLVPLFEGTLASNTQTTREATRSLEQNSLKPGFTITLFEICADESIKEHIRLAAATYVKNFIKKHWTAEEDNTITDDDRTAIKQGIVDLMLNVPTRIQRQISETLAIISASDFPEQWETLLTDLVGQLENANDINTVNGIMQAARSVFEQFRGAYDDDATLTLLKECLDTFAEPLTETYRMIDEQIDDLIKSKAPKKDQEPCYEALITMTQIFYLLNCVDLPEFFEDNMELWMGWFHKYLTSTNPAVTAAPDDTEEGPLERLHSSIIECVALYGERHEEEFEPYFETFIDDVWTLSSSSSPEKIMAPNMDNLMIRIMRFLASIVRKPSHKPLFSSKDNLEAMVENIIIPNLTLRESDMEVYEDNPMDFVRGDIEGNDADTRRRVAGDLVRAICVNCNDEFTPVVLDQINKLLNSYNANRNKQALQKDAAIALMIAVSVRASTETQGVTQLNEKVSVEEFLNNHIFTELQTENINERPLAKAASIKFVATFRNLFSKDELHELLTLIGPFLGADDFVVHTYAGAAIERTLSVKDRDNVTNKGTFRVDPSQIQDIAPDILGAVFERISDSGYPENEYLMKCVMRVAVVFKEKLESLTGDMISSLTDILTRVCNNPTNPDYNHYLFETVASLMKSICTAKPESVTDFVSMLFPPFQIVLEKDIMEFLPYVFQLLAELLDLHPSPAENTHSLSEGYISLLEPCLSLDLWKRKGNIPALTELLCAYIRKGSKYINDNKLLDTILNVWNKLLNTTNEEQFSFTILDALFANMPIDILTPRMYNILRFAVKRVHETHALRVARLFVHSSCVFAGIHGPQLYESTLESLERNGFRSIMDAVVGSTGNRIIGVPRRRETAIGLVRFITETKSFFNDNAGQNIWKKLLIITVELLTTGPPPDPSPSTTTRSATLMAGSTAHPFLEESEETSNPIDDIPQEYTAEYSRLIYTGNTSPYIFSDYPAPEEFLAQCLADLAKERGSSTVNTLIKATPVAKTVERYLASANITL